MHTLGTKKSGNLPSNSQFVTQIIGREKKKEVSVHALDYALKSKQRSLSGKARGDAPCVVNCLTVQNQSSGYWLAVAASIQSPNETHRTKELNPHAAISFWGPAPKNGLRIGSCELQRF